MKRKFKLIEMFKKDEVGDLEIQIMYRVAREQPIVILHLKHNNVLLQVDMKPDDARKFAHNLIFTADAVDFLYDEYHGQVSDGRA